MSLRQAKVKFEQALEVMLAERKTEGRRSCGGSRRCDRRARRRRDSRSRPPGLEGLDHGSVVVAAITSCTNTSNPSVMIGAGLLARNAVKRGLKIKPWVKTSLAPGSLIVTEYYKAAGLLEYLAELGFNIVGYGCTTCIGNSGPLPDAVSKIVKDQNLVVASVLSGNRNFEGRIQSQVRANYLASPPLVVAYALAGKMQIDLTSEPLGHDSHGQPVYPQGHLAVRARDPGDDAAGRAVGDVPRQVRDTCSTATIAGGRCRVPTGERFEWRRLDLHPQPAVLRAPDAPSRRRQRTFTGARVLAMLGDSVTTDHISPAGSIPADSPAGKYLISQRRHADRLQLVRRAPRQPRSHDARHVRQHPAAQPARARHRGRLDDAPAGERGDDDLRRVDALSGGGRAAAGHRRQGVRLGIVARLGGEGHAAARRQGRDRRELRADPPQQPRQHGRAAAVLQSRRERRVAEADRPGDLRHHRHGRYAAPVRRGDRPRHRRGRHGHGIQAIARIDTPEELVAFRHGGILPYVLRQLAKG